MGQRVNFNKKNSNKFKKIGIVFIIIFLLLVILKTIQNLKASLPIDIESSDKAKLYYSIEDYKTIEEVISSFNCKFISKEESYNFLKIYLQFDVDLYTGNNSNENHFLNMSKVIAEFIEYKNFELIDNNKNIDIEVKCEKHNIIEFKINGDINYYLNHDSKANKSLSTKMSNISIQSIELKYLIDNGWNEKNVDWGTKESTCNGYNIYFDEGIKYKNVATDVFNVVFTSKYQGQVAGGLTTLSSKEEIENVLGEATFSNGYSLYGYVSKECYIFFDLTNKEISVYPVLKISNDDENELKKLIKEMNDTSDVKAFATGITGLWNDYDIYDYDSNYVDLRYTLKGVELSISSNSLNNGIFIYQNYLGDRNITDLENVYMKDTDLVFEKEKNRINSELLNRNDEGDYSEEDFRNILGIDFSIRFRNIENGNNKGPLFYSRIKEYPDSELDRNLEISSYRWYDEYRCIYSVNNDGIYIYDCKTRKNVKIISIEENIIINYVLNNEIKYNDTEVLKIDIK